MWLLITHGLFSNCIKVPIKLNTWSCPDQMLWDLLGRGSTVTFMPLLNWAVISHVFYVQDIIQAWLKRPKFYLSSLKHKKIGLCFKSQFIHVQNIADVFIFYIYPFIYKRFYTLISFTCSLVLQAHPFCFNKDHNAIKLLLCQLSVIFPFLTLPGFESSNWRGADFTVSLLCAEVCYNRG